MEPQNGGVVLWYCCNFVIYEIVLKIALKKFMWESSFKFSYYDKIILSSGQIFVKPKLKIVW